jgi:hypothetical protein
MSVCKQNLAFQRWCRSFLTEGETRQEFLTRLFHGIVATLSRQYSLNLSGPERTLLELFVSHMYRLSTGRRSACASTHTDMTAWEYEEYQAWWFHHLDDYWHNELFTSLTVSPPVADWLTPDLCTHIEWFFLLKMQPASFDFAE